MNAMDKFVNKLEAFFHSVGEELKQFADSFLPKVETVLEVALEDIAEMAGRAVMAELPKLISGHEKFGNAVASVVQEVEANGKSIAIQTAQTAVQTAYLTAKEMVNK